MAAPAQGGLGGSQSSLERLTLRRAFAQTEIEHGTHGSCTVGRKGPRIKLNLTYQIGIDDTHRASRSPLRGKMVDVRNLYTVHIKTVLRRTAASHYQIITVSHRRKSHTRITAHDARNVPVGSGAFLYLTKSDDLHAHRSLSRLTIRLRTYGQSMQRLDVLLQLDVHFGRDSRNDIIRRLLRHIPGRRHPE